MTLQGKDADLTDKRFRSKKCRENKLLLPAYVDITAPTIDGIEGISMKVLTTPGKNAQAMLWIELSPATVEFVVRAMHKQIEGGGVDKKPRRKSRKLNGGGASPSGDQTETGPTVDDRDSNIQDGEQSQICSAVSGADSRSDSPVAGGIDESDTMTESQQVHDNYQEPSVSSASSSHAGSDTKQTVSILDMLRNRQ